MRTIIIMIVISFSFVHIANANAVENENAENRATIENQFDADNQDMELQSFVQCNCAKINGWLARLIGIGNNKCLATNAGNSCGGGENFECQSLNGNCGGQNPEVE